MSVVTRTLKPFVLGALALSATLGRAPSKRTPASGPVPAWMGAGPTHGFEENRGQFEGAARFVANGQGLTLSLEPAEAVVKLRRRGPDDPPVAVRMALVGGRTKARLLGRGELPGRTHYLRGAPTEWVKDVPSYAKVEYEHVYPGVDLVFRGDEEGIEYDFVVAPGADPGQVRLAFGGVEQTRVDSSGDLVLETRAGALRQRRPRLYQDIGGERREVAGGFALRGPREVGFRVGPYDTAQPLVIDPTMVYSTFHGGGRGFSGIQGGAVDAEGNGYVVGYFPWDGDRGLPDMFVSKYSPTGVRLFTSNIGGTWSDESKAVTLDALGNIYLTGSTQSTVNCRPFPVTSDAFQPNNASISPYSPQGCVGGFDAFVMKLDPTGRTILYSTFLGGTGTDRGADIKVDDRGRIYVAGTTDSTDFPALKASQAALAGGTDAFLTVFEPSGAVACSTYLGGSGDETVARIVVSSKRETFVAGTTTSADFPTHNNSFQPGYGGGASDAFIAVFSPGGGLKDGTYLGGSGRDEAYGIALNGGKDFVYLTGSTDSPDFPTASALQPTLSFPPEADAFLAKADMKLSGLAYSTYLGVGRAVTCSSPAPCGGVAVDSGGNAYVTANGAFVIKVDPAGASRLETFNGLGGHAIAVKNNGAAPEIFVVGHTGEHLYPTFQSQAAFPSYYMSEFGWLTKLTDGPNPGAVSEESDPRIAYSGAWEKDVSPEHSGGAALRSQEAGAKATITFTGTGLQVIGRRDPSAGILRVSVGCCQNGSIDTYTSPAESRSVLVSFSGLYQGTYTVTLEVTGTHNSRSSGNWVWIDGINVLGAP